VVADAPWAEREGHTSVVDAADAIYVIGGHARNAVNYHDVWVSTNKGASRSQRVLMGGLGLRFHVFVRMSLRVYGYARDSTCVCKFPAA
jgi:hypothetical protein